MYENYVRDIYNCCNLFLKVKSDDELRKSPDKPFQVLMAQSEQRVEIVFLHIMASSSHQYFQVGFDRFKFVQQVCAIDYLVSKYAFLLIDQFIKSHFF